VRKSPAYIRALEYSEPSNGGRDESEAEDSRADGAPEFEDVFDALSWSAARPRKPIPYSFLDLMLGVEEGGYGGKLKPTKRRRRLYRQRKQLLRQRKRLQRQRKRLRRAFGASRLGNALPRSPLRARAGTDRGE